MLHRLRVPTTWTSCRRSWLNKDNLPLHNGYVGIPFFLFQEPRKQHSLAGKYIKGSVWNPVILVYSKWNHRRWSLWPVIVVVVAGGLLRQRPGLKSWPLHTEDGQHHLHVPQSGTDTTSLICTREPKHICELLRVNAFSITHAQTQHHCACVRVRACVYGWRKEGTKVQNILV